MSLESLDALSFTLLLRVELGVIHFISSNTCLRNACDLTSSGSQKSSSASACPWQQELLPASVGYQFPSCFSFHQGWDSDLSQWDHYALKYALQ